MPLTKSNINNHFSTAALLSRGMLTYKSFNALSMVMLFSAITFVYSATTLSAHCSVKKGKVPFFFCDDVSVVVEENELVLGWHSSEFSQECLEVLSTLEQLLARNFVGLLS